MDYFDMEAGRSKNSARIAGAEVKDQSDGKRLNENVFPLHQIVLSVQENLCYNQGV